MYYTAQLLYFLTVWKQIIPNQLHLSNSSYKSGSSSPLLSSRCFPEVRASPSRLELCQGSSYFLWPLRKWLTAQLLFLYLFHEPAPWGSRLCITFVCTRLQLLILCTGYGGYTPWSCQGFAARYTYSWVWGLSIWQPWYAIQLPPPISLRVYILNQQVPH